MHVSGSIKPLPEYLESIKSAKFADYAGLRSTRVETDQEFERMRAFILRRYEGLESTRVFCDENERVFDCIPWEQQPALREVGDADATSELSGLLDVNWSDGHETARAADVSVAHEPPVGAPRPGEQRGPSQMAPGKCDRFGNEMFCREEGTVPCPRYALEDIASYTTLGEFRKVRSRTDVGRHARAFLRVANCGGSSTMNVFKPAINRSNREIVSICQNWVASGQISDRTLQTVEAGWLTHYAYTDTLPHLFVMMTPDGYRTWFYNEQRFIINSQPLYIPGMALSIGAWYELNWELKQATIGGRSYFGWCLTVNRSLIGCFPSSLFPGDRLSREADQIDFGGETRSDYEPGKPLFFPPMGSGVNPHGARDLSRVAAHMDVQYWPKGSALAGGWHIPPAGRNYGVEVHKDPWTRMTNVYFGGPGGREA